MRDRLLGCAWLSIALFVLTLVACDGSMPESELEPAGTSPRPTDVLTSEPLVADSAAGDRPGSGQPEPTLEQDDTRRASTSLSFEETLAALGDAQVETTVSFGGRDEAGAPVAFTWSSVQSTTDSPAARRLDINAMGDDLGAVASTTLVRVGDTGFMYVPEIGCVSGNAADMAVNMTPPLDPAVLLQGFAGGPPAPGSVVVNGVETAEFRFDETALALSPDGAWSVDGVAFVETNQGLLTRVMMTVTGRGDLLDEGQILDGVYEITVDVTDLDGDTISLVPEACQASSLYPIVSDAYEIAIIEDLLVYRSRLALEDVVGFYLAEMPATGWRAPAEPEIFDDLAILNFMKGETSLMITVEYDTESNSVGVLIAP